MHSLLIWSFKDSKQRKEGTCSKPYYEPVAKSRLAPVHGFPLNGHRSIYLQATSWGVMHLLHFGELDLICKVNTIFVNQLLLLFSRGLGFGSRSALGLNVSSSDVSTVYT